MSMEINPAVHESELLCPLCEYNLRGLAEPRCPECGHRSTWEELRREQPNHPYLFERYPNRNAWSFFRTLLASLRPRKFWRELSPTVRPVPSRLMIFAMIVILLGVLGSLTTFITDAVQTAQWYASARQRWINDITTGSKPGPLYRPDAARQMAFVQSSGQTLQQAARVPFPGPTEVRFWKGLWRYGMLTRGFMGIGLLIALWQPFTFASLMIFRASLRQAKIQTMHVVRCVAYTASVLAMVSVMFIAAVPLVSMFPALGYRQIYFGDSAGYVLLAVMVMLCYRLGVAYAKYLRFDKPYLTAIASQVIVLLALWKVALVMHGW
jgi:hypothetical protein